MSRILFTVIGSLGDLHPLIPIALSLRMRGHSVSFCTSNTYRSKLEALSFGFYPLTPDLTAESASAAPLIREIMNPRGGTERLLRRYLLPHLREMYEDLMRAVAGDGRVDLLVSS